MAYGDSSVSSEQARVHVRVAECMCVCAPSTDCKDSPFGVSLTLRQLYACGICERCAPNCTQFGWSSGYTFYWISKS